MFTDEDISFIAPAQLQRGVTRVISSLCGSLPPALDERPESASHSHRTREILFVVDGTSNYQLGDKFYCLQAGDALFIEPWQTHGFFYHSADHDLKHIWFNLQPQRITAAGLEIDHHGQIGNKSFYGNLSGGSRQVLASCWDHLRQAPAQLHGIYQQQLKLAMEIMLNEIAILLLQESPQSHLNNHEDIMEFIADYIDLHHGRNCSLAHLEKLTGYTQYYLCRLFRDYYGKTIGSAINEARMRYVLEQKVSANSKVIADELGFASVMSFWKWRRNNHKLEEELCEQLSISKKPISAVENRE